MKIDASVLIACVSVAISLIVAISNARRNTKNDAEGDASQLTTVIVKLENIANDIREIKNDLRDVQQDIRDLSERQVKMEQQIKVLNNAVFGKGEK